MLPRDPQDFGWLVDNFAASTPGVTHALIVSADGLPLIAAGGMSPDLADPLAAMTSGIISLGNNIAGKVGERGCEQVMLKFSSGHYLFMSIGSLAGFAVLVRDGANLGVVAHQMAQLVDAAEYKRPGQLPDGGVLVVGTGQSGCQIAEDLHLAGRRVHLAVGSAPRVARRYRGRDVVAWLDEMGYYARGIDEFADADAVRFRANHYVTGRDGGHDIDLRAFALEGMELYGRLQKVRSGHLEFGDDLRRNLDAADAVSEGIKDSIDAFIAQRGIAAPPEERYTPVWEPSDGRRTLDGEALSAVVWSTGFGRDHRWIDVPVFDGKGYPTHHRGVTSCPGLYFLGLPWQHTWGSGRFCGVAADAEYLTRRITGGGRGDVRWISGTPVSTYPADDDWVAPRTVA